MNLPFTPAEFFGVFGAYNAAVWPAQLLLLALAIAAVILIARPQPWSGRAISAILALLWAWLGLAYHYAFFAAINPLAYGFAAASVLGALLFLWHGVVRRRLQFRPAAGWRNRAGAAMLAYALVGYPALSIAVGHRYPQMPTFGLPCPTTLFTFGVLAFLVRPHPRGPLVVPVLWCFVGAQAAFLLGVPEDLGLLVAAALGIVLLVRAHVPGATARIAAEVAGDTEKS